MVARFRISDPAREDLGNILATSAERWGDEGQERYAALLVAALRTIARDPVGPTTRDRAALLPGLRSFRSFHVQHARRRSVVDDSVHVMFYRAAESAIEIVRVLHERMDPASHVATTKPTTKRRRGT